MITVAGVGSELGTYRIDGPLPGRATGATLRARDISDGRMVALEIIAGGIANPDAVAERLAGDTHRLNELGHPNIAAVWGSGVQGDVAYAAWQLAEGLDLAVLTDRLGGLSFRRATRLLGEVAEALDAAHAAGLVHGSLESSRVRLKNGGEADLALVDGFAVAAVLEELGDQAGRPVGVVPGFAAPERIRGGPATPAADVYALGCVYFNALTGRVPFIETGEAHAFEAHLNERPPSLTALAPELPPALQEVLDRALAEDPQQRFGSAGELARAALEARDRPDPEAEREAERQRVIAGWERSLAAGAAAWSPENPVLAPTGDAGPDDPADGSADPPGAEPPGTAATETEAEHDASTEPPSTERAAEPPPATSSSSSRGRRGRRVRAFALGAAITGAVAVGVLLVAGSEDAGEGDATPPPPPPPPAQADGATGAGAAAGWPARDGYTAVIHVSPASSDGAAARQSARAATRRGYRSGVLESSDFANLQPNLLVAFAGVYDGRAQASRAAEQLRRQGVAAAPYVRFVDRGE